MKGGGTKLASHDHLVTYRTKWKPQWPMRIYISDSPSQSFVINDYHNIDKREEERGNPILNIALFI